ncbi:ABC transporter substrate-binding protein [Vibrio mytili]|uniref:ABC transporter substrate-binding protein n=1 Tax=Vibrio mytili TaxID=50718 RepID=UPI002F3F6F70
MLQRFIFITTLCGMCLSSALASETQPRLVRVFGAAYLSEMKPLLDDFSDRNPDIDIQYKWMSSEDLDRYIRDQQQPQPDVTISSVMHLQLRLVNDGYALEHKRIHKRSSNAHELLPDWSQWRDELFGFSFEPAVVVFNKSFLEGKQIPTNRIELMSFIRRYSDEFMGKIGVYDIRKVGIGYLLWSFERQQARNYGQFLELFNLHYARTFDSSRDMLDALSSGEIVMAYNILGSYAQSWQQLNDDVSITSMSDYTPVIIRTAFINRTTKNVQGAQKFIDYLLSSSGQWVMSEQTNMPPIRTDINSVNSASYMRQQYAEQLKPLPLDVRLLVFADESKRQIVITEWENALKDYD